MADAVEAGGGHVVEVGAAEALVWGSPRGAEHLEDVLVGADHIRWVQLPWAGVEHFAHLVDDGRVWTCGKGVYAEPVAELALTLGLAGLRNLKSYATAQGWTEQAGRNLLNGRVTVVGGGGITESLLRLLEPFDAHVTVVRNRVQPMDGADEVIGPDNLHDALPGADLVVLALALTPETDGLIAAPELSLMEPHAWLVNVARGRHVVTADLVTALERGDIGGAALDVTDPEPLPSEHRLWSLPNCLITPHTGNTAEMARPLLAERLTVNVRRWAAGDDLLGPVDAELGY
jgi:phosphoglycerate dehydrogenase-like enzyme